MLDTNVLLSALLFANGRLSWLRPCWQRGALITVVAEPTVREFLRVLAYPKFRLNPADQERLLEDLLPWCESLTGPIPTSSHRVRNPHDQVFLDLALAAATPVLVSGDADLLVLQESVNPLLILSPAAFQTWLAGSL